MSDGRSAPASRSPYAAGTAVEVRSQFDRSWSDGFVIDSVTDEGRYRVRRQSDGTVLPVELDPADVRRVRKNSMWWI